jgi:cytochrome c oxidase cbb3-type subunit 3
VRWILPRYVTSGPETGRLYDRGVMAEARPRATELKAKRRLVSVAAGLVVAAAGYFAYAEARNYFTGRQLVMADPDTLPSQPGLVEYAVPVGRAAYAANCASCHGGDMKGDRKNGVPDLTDDVWLYDFGRVSDIERTILYGIRSGLGKSRNVTDMPAIGLQKALSPNEIKDVIAFVLSLSKRPEPADAVERGEKLFEDKGVCYDCHGRDATGISDYGAPDLADDEWLYGGDEATLYKSIYDGRHGKCPAWVGKLSFSTIRALAVYIHAMSKESSQSPARAADSTTSVQSLKS